MSVEVPAEHAGRAEAFKAGYKDNNEDHGYRINAHSFDKPGRAAYRAGWQAAGTDLRNTMPWPADIREKENER